jgi:hypothetical protein
MKRKIYYQLNMGAAPLKMELVVLKEPRKRDLQELNLAKRRRFIFSAWKIVLRLLLLKLKHTI